MGIRNLLIEGGDKINKKYTKKRLANQFYLFKSPKKFIEKKKYIIFTSLVFLKKNIKKNQK